jgi:hypothetical protein
MMEELKPCPFCGGNKLTRSVDGGILPTFMTNDKQMDIWEKTPYVTTCSLSCDDCSAMIEGYAASANSDDDLYTKAIENCYEKWNRRAE